MNLVEFDAKALLRNAGLAVPDGVVIRDGETATIDTSVYLKAQIAAGGRSKQGLVLPAGPADGQQQLRLLRERMRALGSASPVVLAEDRTDAARECYLAWCIDDVAQAVTLLFSAHGGIHVEEDAGALTRLHFAAGHAPGAHEFVAFFINAGIAGRPLGALCRFAAASWRVFVQADAQLLEVNPLAVTPQGGVVALDAKIVLDDNAQPRHGEWRSLYSAQLADEGMSSLERRAARSGFTFIELDGEVAVLAGGAGVGMALLDLLADAGMPAANFVDASGGSANAIFEELGRLVFEHATRPEVKAILLYFTLSATSLASVVNGLLKLLDDTQPPKPLVVGFLSSGAAERDMTFEQARGLLGQRGYRCAQDLPGVMAALHGLRASGADAETLRAPGRGDPPSPCQPTSQEISLQATETQAKTAPSNDLLVERTGNVVRITINRPHRRNALTDAVLIGMGKAISETASDPSIRAIVLTGAGDKAFCAGADLTPGDTPFQPDFARLTLPMGDLARAVHLCRIPIIGRINGMCLAGGMGLFGLCDMAIASDDARFGMPEVKVGIFPMQILTLLRDLIPPRFLNEMCMTGRPIDAQKAASIGLLNQVVPAAELDQAVDALVADIIAVSPMAVRRGKYAMRAVESMSFHEMMAFTETAISGMIQTEDAREGLAAFNERRTPHWRGR